GSGPTGTAGAPKIPGVEGQQVTLQTFAHGTSLVAVGVANRAAVSALIPAGNLASACRWAGASACWAAASPAKAAMQPSGSAFASARMAPAQPRGPARASRLDDPT